MSTFTHRSDVLRADALRADRDPAGSAAAGISPSPIWWALPARFAVAGGLALLLWVVIVWALA